MKVHLDFDTPNDTPTQPMTERRAAPRSSNAGRSVCPYCYQPGIHQSAAQCLRALERTGSN